MKILKTISLVVTLACACSVMAAVANNSGQPKGGSHGPNKHESYSRLMRVTMKDGSTEEFLMESVRNLTFEANPNDSSDIDEKPIDEDPEMPDEPDRTPEARSMSSSATESSSSDKFDPEVKSSDSKSSDSKSSDSKSSDSKSSDSKSSDSKSSDSKSSDGKSSDSKSSDSKSSDSKSSGSMSSDSKQADDKSSSSAASSSSSEKTTTTPTIDYTGTRILWNSKNYTLSIFSRQAGNGSFVLFDTQGAKVGGGNVYVTRGSTSLSLEYLKLAKGNYVVQLEIGNAKIQQTISVLGK